MEKILESIVRGAVRRGNLQIETASGRVFTVGDGTGPKVGIKIASKAAQSRLLRDPELAFGELYMDGLMTVTHGDIYQVIFVMASNLHGAFDSRWMKALRRLRVLLRPLAQFNSQSRAERNVAHHYDIDSRVYALFLDSDRQYSCAYFEHPGATLEDAQLAKKRHIAAKLLIEPGQRVLDIGCGWGGLGLYLAKTCDAQVTGVTLSREQLAIAEGRVREAQLEGRVDFRFQDYRDVAGKYDRIVSVGMFEHVGVGFYNAFFRKIADGLADDGVALLHTIGTPMPPAATNPWITKYIFPGGYTPAMSEVLPAIERSGLVVTDIEVLRLHYAETLKAWRERFMARRDEALALYDERFCRMWEFYLAGCEAGFRVGDVEVFQFQLSKKIDAAPLTRNYIAEREEQLREREGDARRLRLAGE